MPLRTVLVPSLLALACLAPGADIGWAGAPGAKPPTGWSISAAAEAKVEFLERAIEITAPSGRQALAVAAAGLPDGSDDRPLRLGVQVSASGKGALLSYPALVALEWGGGAVFAVGLGDDPHTKHDDRRAWAIWSGGGQAGSDHAETELAPGSCPAHLRLVLTSREVAAYGSRDGWTWTRIAGMRRDRLGATGSPARVVIGRGQTRSGAAGLASDPPGDAKGQPCTYRFADLRLETGGADVPASALRSYAKKDSFSDTIEALVAAGVPRSWRILGPVDAKKAELGNVLPAGFTAGAEWKTHELAEPARYIQLGKLLPGGGSQVRYAATEVATTEPGWLRFRFDGMPHCWLWVDGRLVAASERANGEAEADRLSASVWLPAGTHQVVMATRSGDGRSAIILRHEPGDPRARIALLRRLAIDFAGDEQLIDAPFEMARLWEGLGFAREAAAALSEAVAGDAELAERALAERARLFHQLGDEAGATAETAALQKLWEAQAADPVAAARRTARLWQRLDVPERAAGILGEALKLPGLDGQTRCSLVVDRARLRRALGDEPGVASELRAAAEHLPATDATRFDLLCAAARIDPATPKSALDALAAQATDALRARQLAGMHAARKDEPARLAARRAAAAQPGSPLALPAIELAEDLATAKDEAGALQLYRQELARRSLPEAKDLAGARTALVRAVLAETPAGAALLAETARVSAASVKPMEWQVRGPVPLGDWSVHEKPPFDAAQVPSGKDWRPVPAEAWSNGVLDHSRVGGGDNIVWYVATTIASDAARTVTASFGADDGLTVWLNGERLYSDRVQRGLTPDSIVLSLPLRQGANVLLCAVQNGGGPSAIQYRMRREPWPASDLAVALASASSDRAGSAQMLAELAVTLLGAERSDEAWALARTAVACWPERSDLTRDLAGRAITQPGWKVSSGALLDLIGWFDAALADRRWDDNDTRRWVQENVPGLLLGAGLVDEALARLRRNAMTELDPLAVAGAHLREADIWLGMGYPRHAAAAVQRARDAAPGEESVDREADRRRRGMRTIKGDQVTVTPPFELTTVMRTAERALTTDPERAAKDFQQIVEGSPDQPIQLADGRLRGAASFAANRLRSASAAVQQAWRDANEARAASALARLADSDDPQAFAAISGRWPLAPAAAEALRREADLWAARGAWQLARGAALRCLAEFTAPDQSALLLRAAQASARLGDAAELDRLLARLAKAGKPLPWDGRQLPPDQLATALRGLLPAPSAAEPAPAALIVQLPAYAQAMRLATVADARLPVPAAELVGDDLVVATPDDLACLAPDGTVRWTLPREPQIAASAPSIASNGEASLAVADGVAVAGVLRGGSRRLVAVEVASGRPLWSSGSIPELAGATIASAPTMSGGRVWAWFVEPSRGFTACIDARTGAVLWRSTLATGPVRQPMAHVGDVFAAGNAPAPALSGRELFVATDAGQIGAFDAVDGRLLWLHTYARTAIDANASRTALHRLMARGRGAILADGERVYVAPRDSLGLLAIDRVGGGSAWTSELADVHELVALTSAGLVAIGPAVTVHNPATGALRLRWRPSSGELPGRPAVAGDGLWIPLRYGPLRLGLADGAIRQGPAWSALGMTGPAPGALRVDDGRVLALADGQVVATRPGAGKPASVQLAVRMEPSTGTVAPAGDAAPTALALGWELPIGYVENLYRPADAKDGEIYVVAGSWLHRVDAANGRIAWSVPTAGGLRGISCDGGMLLMLSEGQYAVLDRATGRQRWGEPISRDPSLHAQWNERWRVQAQLLPGRVARWTAGDGAFSMRRGEDGVLLCSGRTEGGIWGMHVVGDELQILVTRNNAMVMELRRLADGVRTREVALDLAGGSASLLRVSGGGLAIGNGNGGVLWDPDKRTGVRFDLGMEWMHTAWHDGDVINLVGQAQHRHRSAFLDASGKLIAQDEFIHHDEWTDRIRFAPRIIDGMRVQIVQNRNGQTGYLIRKLDGAETAWLPVREEWRRHQYALAPLGAKAIGFATDKDGWLRAQLVNPKAGKIEVDSAFGVTMVGRMQPLTVAGSVIVPTTRGLVSIVPVAAPAEAIPGRTLGETHADIWRLTKPLVVDGRLDEWDEQAGWEQPPAQTVRAMPAVAAPAEPMAAWVGWRDDAVAVALSIPVPPANAATTLLALDTVRGEFVWHSRPMLLALTWDAGACRQQVVHAVLGDDPSRPPIQARAASDGTMLTWEVLIPWGWLYPGSERPGRDHWLRWGAMVDLAEPPGGALELGIGLAQGFDKAGLTRLRLVDAKPPPDAKPPKQVAPKKGRTDKEREREKKRK